MKKKRFLLQSYRIYRTFKANYFETSIHLCFPTYEAVPNPNTDIYIFPIYKAYQSKQIVSIKTINYRLQSLSKDQKTIWALHSAGFSNEQIEGIFSAPQNWAKKQIDNLYAILLQSTN
ncbi:MAG: hypothetical protein ACRDCN_12820 [Tannerellaceae bacterium]